MSAASSPCPDLNLIHYISQNKAKNSKKSSETLFRRPLLLKYGIIKSIKNI
ncbi:hypothetical protein MCC93_01420 [Morococcus cerebrosus]|uniref:Uncharacterized protein n=1 Tax=Morococcus cerebrosus TaxID=1056807 RepID=A0A0C1ELM1_9NEIS|nr:hypothetical protein MCC93_01420 [Morococcus cerebrosus]